MMRVLNKHRMDTRENHDLREVYRDGCNLKCKIVEIGITKNISSNTSEVMDGTRKQEF